MDVGYGAFHQLTKDAGELVTGISVTVSPGVTLVVVIWRVTSSATLVTSWSMSSEGKGWGKLPSKDRLEELEAVAATADGLIWLEGTYCIGHLLGPYFHTMRY